jgi:hypothetical protein
MSKIRFAFEAPEVGRYTGESMLLRESWQPMLLQGYTFKVLSARQKS